MPENDYNNFYNWLKGNESAFIGDKRPANEEEIKEYICLRAADDFID